MGKGRLFVFSAPSGAGKSTILARLRDIFPHSVYSISHTTRPIREGETDGKDYFFVSREKFLEMVRRGEFLEWEEILGNYYGTSKEFITRALEDGRWVFMDIDVKGAKNIKRCFPDAVLIFILPPSMEELQNRLSKRGTETKEVIQKRLELGSKEILEAKSFDYAVVNKELHEALREIEKIIREEAERDGHR
ncbi:MAG: guanylate kinase [Desulfatiglandales bacterium]